jgi:hypothetical protein
MTTHLTKVLFLVFALGVPLGIAPAAPKGPGPVAAPAQPAPPRRTRLADSCVELPAAPVVAVPSCSGGSTGAP